MDKLRIELDRIDDQATRELAKVMTRLLCPPDHWFWQATASSSGQHHPPECRGVGGLVRHTRLASAWLEQLLLVYPKANADAARLAVLWHDCRKYEHKDSMPVHGQLGCDAIFEVMGRFELTLGLAVVVEIAANAVRTHMGVWSSTPVSVDDMTPTQRVVHLADYCASRDINLD